VRRSVSSVRNSRTVPLRIADSEDLAITSIAIQDRPSLSVLILAIAACKSSAPAEEHEELAPAAVTCKATTATEIADIVEVAGSIAPPPKLDAVITSPVAGRVAQLTVEEGDKVAANALIAVIDDPALPAGRIEADAGVAVARANKAAADNEVARQQRLVDSGIGARRDLDDARAKAAAAAAELDAANARAGLATRNNARRELRAPFAGVVLHLWKRAGESVDGTTATPIAEVADITTLELRAAVPPGSLSAVRDGQSAVVTITGGEGSLPATVTRVSPAVDPATGLATVRIQIEGTHRVLVGSAAVGQIAIGKRPGVLVPATSLRRSPVGADEVVVCDKGVARVRGVTLGQRRDTDVEIAKGVSPGEQIVIDHALGLEDGQALVAPEK